MSEKRKSLTWNLFTWKKYGQYSIVHKFFREEINILHRIRIVCEKNYTQKIVGNWIWKKKLYLKNLWESNETFVQTKQLEKNDKSKKMYVNTFTISIYIIKDYNYSITDRIWVRIKIEIFSCWKLILTLLCGLTTQWCLFWNL